MTWKEIKDTSLQLMFSYSNRGAVSTALSNTDYTLAMPMLANLALRDLSVACPIRRSLYVKQYEETNITSLYTAYTSTSGQTVIEAPLARSFYCDIDGTCTVFYEYVQSDLTVVVIESEIIANASYAPVRYAFPAHDLLRVRIVGNVRIKNYAFYATEYAEDDIPSPAEWQAYSISDLITAQSQLPFREMAEKPVRVNEYDISPYVRWDGIDRLMIPSAGPSIAEDDEDEDASPVVYVSGEIFIHYFAYPTPITSATSDTHIVELDSEAADLIPFYIASVLYSEDDANLALTYRNTYREGKANLSAKGETFGSDQFISTTGWI
jgi:hypothetical protein